jgi:hypothetical protein
MRSPAGATVDALETPYRARESSTNLVAYDHTGLIIGRSAPPPAIHALK